MLTCSCQIQLLTHQRESISVDSSSAFLVDSTASHPIKQQHRQLIGSKAKEILSPAAISSHYVICSSHRLPYRVRLRRREQPLLTSHSPEALSPSSPRELGEAMPTNLVSISLADLWWNQLLLVPHSEQGEVGHQEWVSMAKLESVEGEKGLFLPLFSPAQQQSYGRAQS